MSHRAKYSGVTWYHLILVTIAGGIVQPSQATDCPDRFESTALDYLGRNADSSKSYWLILSNRPDSFRLSAPGVASIDQWQTESASIHISASDIVRDDVNGTHKLDRLKADGSFDCFLQSRNQLNPLLPPTWRPPVKPERPEVVRPEKPSLPEVIRPGKPELPVAVRPELPQRPVVVLPARPELPNVVLPELPELPIVNKPTPIQPVEIKVNEQSYMVAKADLLQYCPMLQPDSKGGFSAESLSRCENLNTLLAQVPLTPGRDLLEPTEWNSWVDFQVVHSSNQRGFSEIDERVKTVTLGADKQISPDVALGLMLLVSDQKNESFSGQISRDSRNIMAGPYLAYRLSDHWSVFGQATVGEVQHRYKLLALSGENNPVQYGAGVNVLGEYPLSENTTLRPKLGFSYLYEQGKSYRLSGNLRNTPLAIYVAGQSSESGQLQASTEINTRLETADGHLFVPYGELGVYYNTINQNNELQPDAQGFVRGGVRTLAGKNWQIDLNVGYQSVGVSQLDTWDYALFIAYSF